MNTYATSLTLYRVVNDAYTGKQKDYVVTLVTTTEGDKTRYTTLDYNLLTAVMDPAGTTAAYNEVDVIPGSISYKDRPNGYTKLFFNNCLGADETRTINPVPNLYWKGASYETRTYAASGGDPVSTSKTTFTAYTRDILNDQGTKTRLGYYVRPTKVVVVQDGITVTNDNTYDAATGLLTQTLVSGPVTLQTNYTYFYQAYDPSRTLNRLTPVVFTKQKTNGVNTAANAVRYKAWSISSTYPSGILAPADTYSWKRSGSIDFSTWDTNAAPAYSDWLKTGAITARDYTGTVLETADGLNRPARSTLLDLNRFRVVASVMNAATSDIGYTSFESDATSNINESGTRTTTDAKTGVSCLNLSTTGLSKIGLSTAQTYRVSFWAKSGSGQISVNGGAPVTLNAPDWKLFEYTVSNVSQVTIAKGSTTTVLIDEVRILPASASMVTYINDPVYGVKSQTDDNGQTTYYDYDEWGRIKTVKDDGKNITTVRSYNFKN
jgi:YD repeat-containing protein